MGAETVVEARSRKSISMRNLNGINASVIQEFCDGPNLFYRVLMADGVHSIAQSHILNVKARLLVRAH
jgi:hypothetical protein